MLVWLMMFPSIDRSQAVIYHDLDMLTDGLQPSTPGSLSVRDRLIFCFTGFQGFIRFKTVKNQSFQTPLCVASRDHFNIISYFVFIYNINHLIYITYYFPCSCIKHKETHNSSRLFSYFYWVVLTITSSPASCSSCCLFG